MKGYESVQGEASGAGANECEREIENWRYEKGMTESVTILESDMNEVQKKKKERERKDAHAKTTRLLTLWSRVRERIARKKASQS